MKRLPRQPKTPKGVKYALTVPQSVLFADLSLQGNRRAIFREVMDIDYEPAYIAINAGGAMSWNYDNDEGLNQAFMGGGSTIDAISSFIDLMDRTTKKLDKVSRDIESSDPYMSSRELSHALRIYWRAYEEHMTSLFTFWNVERTLSDTLTEELKKAGRQAEIDDSLVRYLKPDKPNYFVKERVELRKLAENFKITSSTDLKSASKALTVALERHRDKYDFLLAPFNLDNPLSIRELLGRAKEIVDEPVPAREIQDTFSDLNSELKRLAALVQRFTFWKSERLDMFALADSRAKDLYRQTASALSLKPKDLFAMTSSEIMQSLQAGEAVVDKGTIEKRQKSYCLILSGGKIDFYEPSTVAEQETRGSIAELVGVAASTGIATGKVRIIKDLKDAKGLMRGEVIVTAMTRPEMGAALDRAVAFVTDEGGMLCHAAIISREMKKPCVIATVNATKQLKNGQLIEVDGTEGVVRVISAD